MTMTRRTALAAPAALLPVAAGANTDRGSYLDPVIPLCRKLHDMRDEFEAKLVGPESERFIETEADPFSYRICDVDQEIAHTVPQTLEGLVASLRALARSHDLQSEAYEGMELEHWVLTIKRGAERLLEAQQ